MLNRNVSPRYRPTHIRPWHTITLFLLALFLFPAHTSAHELHISQPAANGPAIVRVDIGVGGQYQDGNWVPVQVTLANNGADFQGKLTVNIPTSPYGPNIENNTYTYQSDVDLASASNKRITLYVPLNKGTQANQSPVTVQLLDNAGHIVASNSNRNGPIGPNFIVVGVLSDQKNTGALNQALQSTFNTNIVYPQPLTAQNFPDHAEILQNFDIIILDNFATSSLNKDQLGALQDWVYQGGSLIVAGGPEWNRTLSALPSNLLPVAPTTTDTIPGNTHLLPISTLTKSEDTQSDTLTSSITISKGQLQPGSSVLLTSGDTPLVAQARRGQGKVCYLAYDPFLEPFVGWQNTSKLWSGLLLRALGDQILTGVGGNNYNNIPWHSAPGRTTMDTLLKLFLPALYPPIWLVLGLLLSYVLFLGPIRLLIVRHFKRRDWGWRIVLATIIVFTLLSYGLAVVQKGNAIVSSTVSIVQMNYPDQKGTMAHTTTYLGVFVPNQGDYIVHIPGTNLVQPTQANPYYGGPQRSSTQKTTITAGANGVDVDLRGVDIWSARTLVTQSQIYISGSITSDLTLQKDTVSGTVTNNLSYDLSDAYLLVGNDYLVLGNIPAHGTKPVSLTLSNSLNIGPNNGPPMNIADLIAGQQGMPQGPNYPYNWNNQMQDETHRHIATLESLSGSICEGGGPCYSNVQVVTNANGTIIKRFVGGNGAVSTRDPLLIPGSAATFIAWAKTPDGPGSQITVNGQHPSGVQDTMLQAPLALKFGSTVQVPSSLIDSQVIDIQQNNAQNIQELTPGTYTMTTGTITFEFLLPQLPKVTQSSLTLSTSTNATGYQKQANGTTTDIDHLQAYLYNWQTRNWDTVYFKQASLSVANAQPYLGPGGRILLHLKNQDDTLGTAIFTKPDIKVQVTAAS